MLLFGHAALPFCLVLGWEKVLGKRWPFGGRSGSPARATSAAEEPTASTRPGARSVAVDYRLVLAGSLLPDMIDKPIGIYLFGDTFSNGRIFGHTLLLFLLLLGLGVLLRRRMQWPGLAVLAVGSGFHLVLDQMWNEPRTLWWPMYGLAFDRHDLSNWMAGILEALRSEPLAFGAEIAGAATFALLGLHLARSGKVIAFLKSGAL